MPSISKSAKCVWTSTHFRLANRLLTRPTLQHLTRSAMATAWQLETSRFAERTAGSMVRTPQIWNEILFLIQLINHAVYIPISPRQGERQLTVSIVSNGFGNGNGRPNWNIAVHQFECPFGQSRSLNVLPVTDKQEIMRTPRTLVSDWLAPAGCLQYHALPTGQIESFNFNNGAGCCNAFLVDLIWIFH